MTTKSAAGVFLCIAAFGGAARADGERELSAVYLDIFAPEAVGFRGDHTFDLSDGSDFLTQQTIRGGTFLGAGHGFRNLFGFRHGALLIDEMMIAVGSLSGAEMPWSSNSRATRGEVLIGAGWGFSTGPFYFHTASVVGGAYLGFDVTGPLTPAAVAIAQNNGSTSSSPKTFSLSAWDLRIGQQVGVHVQIAHYAALFVDATVDYDLQWRVRAGISVGSSRLDDNQSR